VGTSLEVWPVAGLPEETLGAGGCVAVLNQAPTRVDDRAELVLREPAGAILEAAVAWLR
jgi:NAD-dependent deacetylase